MKDIIRQILKEETEDLGERTKIEQLITKQFGKPNFEGVLFEPDNFYGVVVDVYDTDYGKQCHITILMKKPFKAEDSDMLHQWVRKGKEKIKDMFSNYFDSGISGSISTIESYKDHKWFYDERKKHQ